MYPNNGNNNLRAPTPKRPSGLKLSHSANNSNVNLARNVFQSPLGLSFRGISRSATPLTPQPNPIEQVRLKNYNLDLPNATEIEDIYDPNSRFYSRIRPRTLNLQALLPYEAELPLDQSRYLSHIVSHLYIAIKSLDISGTISVSTKDLEKLKFHGAHLGDEELSEDENEETDGEDESDDSDESDSSDGNEENVEDDMSREISSGIGSAATDHGNPHSSLVVSVRHWTQELRTWLKMKNDLPFDLRIALAKVYYSLSLANGKSLPMAVFVRMFALLTKYAPLVLKEKGLILDYRPLFDLLDTKYPQPDASYDSLAKLHSRKYLLRLGISANYFYPESDFDEIFSKLGSRLSLNTSSLSLASLLCLLPLHSPKILDILPPLFHIWTIVWKTKGVDSHLTNILGVSFEKILTESFSNNSLLKFKEYGFLAKDQLLFIFSQLLNSFNIQPQKFGYSSSSNYYIGYANIIVFSINGERALNNVDGVFFHLETLLNSIETYLHPSNTDVWSTTCTRFIQDVVSQFYRRFVLENNEEEHLYKIPAENKLSSNVVKKFVKLLLPKLLLGLQSKKSSIVNINVDSIGILCELEPQLVLNVLLLDIYESLQSVISNHRLTVALKLLAKLSKHFATQKIFRCHVVRLLSLTLPGIDSNDLKKTLLTLNVIASFASYIPFYDLSKAGDIGSGLAFEVTQNHLQFLSEKVYTNQQIDEQELFTCEDEKQALISSSTLFEDFFSVFAFKIFNLLENLPDQSLHQSGSEASLESALPRTLLILFNAISEEHFAKFSDRFYNFVNEGVNYNSIDLTAEIIGTIIKHDPKSQTPKYMDLVLDRINEQIKSDNAGKVRSGFDVLHRDKPLFNYLAILSEIIRYAGEHVLNYSYKLTTLSRYLLKEVKGPIMYNASYLVTQLLKTLTTIRLKEQRLLSSDYVKEYGVTEEAWGGFFNESQRFDHLNFEWYVPDRKEVDFAVQFFTEHVRECFNNLDELMRDPGKSDSEEPNVDLLEFTDNFKKNLLYLSRASTGIAYLLDPAFEESDKGANKLNAKLLDKRLRTLNLSQRSLASPVQTGPSEVPTQAPSEIPTQAPSEAPTPRIPDVPSRVPDDPRIPDEPHFSEDQFETHKDTVSLSRVASDTSLFEQVDMSRESSINVEFDSSGKDGYQTPEGLMNPQITSRAQKLYTSNYYFGNTKEERQRSELYNRIHMLHKEIGQKFHEISRFLVAHYPNDVKLFKTYLYALKVWFCDYGCEKSLKSFDDNFITYKYLSGIQGLLYVRKPYTRITFGSRIERFHRQRVIIHAANRIQTKLDKTLLSDVISLSMSVYSSIASSAQDTLDGAMQKLVGSYTVLINTVFKNWEAVLKENDHKKIKSALSMFSIGRLKNRIHSDYRNVTQYARLLLQSMAVDDQETIEIARAHYKQLAEQLKIPNPLCIFNESCADFIKPSDAVADSDAKLLKAAKDKKVALYFSYLNDLQQLVFQQELKNNHWKLSAINLDLLVILQAEYNIKTDPDIVLLLADKAKVSHPTIANIAINGLVRIFAKLKSLSSYSYDLRSIADTKTYPKEIQLVSTDNQKLGHNFSEDFFAELSRKDDAEYFIDNKIFRGWLFWDKEIMVVKSGSSTEMDLEPHEKSLLERLNTQITKDWLSDIIKHALEDNEEGSKFQGNHIYLFSFIIHLISVGHLTTIKYQDIIDIASSIYVRDEKSAHVVVCEIICGLLIASRYTSPEFLPVRDQFVAKTLAQAFKDLSPENNNVWKVFSWWLVDHVDTRRYGFLFQEIFDYIPVPGEETPFVQATRLSFLRTCLTTITWKYRDADKLTKHLSELLLHPYQVVREQIASTYNVALYCYFNQSLADSKSFIDTNVNSGSLGAVPYQLPDYVVNRLVEAFEAVEFFKTQIPEGASVQEISESPYIYGTRTLVVFLKQLFRSSSSISLVGLLYKHISPFLLALEHMRDTCKLININPGAVYLQMAKITFRSEHIDGIVQLILDNGCIANPSWHQRLVILTFTEIFYFRQLLLLTTKQRQSLFSYVSDLLANQHLEVREAAARALSGMIHCSPTVERDIIIQEYIEKYATVLKKYKKLFKKKNKNFKQTDAVSLHGATLGLGSLVSAFPYLSPPPEWFPDVLGLLANNTFGVFGVVDKTSKGILSNFKKTRQDTWHIDSKVFSEEQLEDLEGVLRDSYFV